jgi:hypothetical protein
MMISWSDGMEVFFSGFAKIAKYLRHPLVLIGFALMLVYGIHKEILRSGLLPMVTPDSGGEIIKLILQYGFWLALCPIVLGFGLAAWKDYTEKKKSILND